jgi:hypothetical protein
MVLGDAVSKLETLIGVMVYYNPPINFRAILLATLRHVV